MAGVPVSEVDNRPFWRYTMNRRPAHIDVYQIATKTAGNATTIPQQPTHERSNKMPLGRVDFASAPTYEPLPDGDYDGQTGSWEAKPTNAGDSTNIEAKFILTYVDPNTGDEQKRTIMNRWNLKPGALWRIKRDLIAMGADPTDFESKDVDIEAILNELFGAIPTPVVVTLAQRVYTPENGEPRTTNEVTKVVKRAA